MRAWQVALHMLHMSLDELLISLDMLTNPFEFQFSFGCGFFCGILWLWQCDQFSSSTHILGILFFWWKKKLQMLIWGSCIDGFFIKCVIFKKISVFITVIINFTKTLMYWFSFFSWFKKQHGAYGVSVKAQGL